MTVENILNLLNKKYPFEIAEDWDNVGLILGEKTSGVNKILIALETTLEVIDYAANNNFDLIITHHPMIFHPIKRLEKDDVIGYKLIKAIQNSINVIAMHTNLDSATDGLNEYVLEKLDLDFRYVDYDKCKNRPYRIVSLENKKSVFDIAENIKRALNVSHLKIVHNPYYNELYVQKIAIITGSGSSFIPELQNDVDLIITGDISHHSALDAMEKGVNLIDFGHHESESLCVDLLFTYLRENTNIYVEKMHTDRVLKIY